MEKAIEEQMRDAEVAVESPIIVEADKELDVEMSPTQLKSAGYVYIYDTVTRERSLCNRNMLMHNLRKKRSDGSNVFTTVKPAVGPKRGHLKCMLHPDEPGRYHYDDLGLAVCGKSNLTSPYQVKRHMMKRHKVEYATIREEIDTAEKEKDRKLREALIKIGSKK